MPDSPPSTRRPCRPLRLNGGRVDHNRSICDVLPRVRNCAGHLVARVLVRVRAELHPQPAARRSRAWAGQRGASPLADRLPEHERDGMQPAWLPRRVGAQQPARPPHRRSRGARARGARAARPAPRAQRNRQRRVHPDQRRRLRPGSVSPEACQGAAGLRPRPGQIVLCEVEPPGVLDSPRRSGQHGESRRRRLDRPLTVVEDNPGRTASASRRSNGGELLDIRDDERTLWGDPARRR